MLPRGGCHPYRSRLRADSGFFFELQFCYENGIPHSQLLDWHPTDRAKMLAFAMEKAERCQLCGTAPWEWDPKRGGKKRAYDAVSVFCPGCYAKAAARHADDGNTDGYTIELARNDNSVQAAIRHMKARRRAERGRS